MHIIAALPGLHGLLITTLGIIDYRRTKRGKKCLIVELICGCLLIVAWLLIITITSMFATDTRSLLGRVIN